MRRPSPKRTRALILINSLAAFARHDDYDFANTPDEYEQMITGIEQVWGSGTFLREAMPDVVVDDERLRDLARIERESMPPAVVGAVLRSLYAIDVRAVLPAISVPTLVLHTVGNRLFPVEAGRHLAQHIPNARPVELPGADVVVWFGSAAGPAVVDEIEEFLTGTRLAADHTRMLTTLLFTDVVGSTDQLAAVGDRAWRTVLDRHDEAVRRQLARFRATERSSPAMACSPPLTAPPAPSVVGRRSATRPARSASTFGSGSTLVKSNDAVASSRASPSTSHVASAKPRSRARSSCPEPSSTSWQGPARCSTTAANTTSKAYPRPGDSSPSPPEPAKSPRPKRQDPLGPEIQIALMVG
jgi:hypothetical protein